MFDHVLFLVPKAKDVIGGKNGYCKKLRMRYRWC